MLIWRTRGSLISQRLSLASNRASGGENILLARFRAVNTSERSSPKETIVIRSTKLNQRAINYLAIKANVK